VIPQVVYLLCALTSGTCAWLLFRGYRRSHTRLLLWSAASFAVFTANNAMLFIDLVVVPDVDLSLVRAALSLIGVLVLVVGLIWDGQS
jgi:hypothetical protein